MPSSGDTFVIRNNPFLVQSIGGIFPFAEALGPFISDSKVTYTTMGKRIYSILPFLTNVKSVCLPIQFDPTFSDDSDDLAYEIDAPSIKNLIISHSYDIIIMGSPFYFTNLKCLKKFYFNNLSDDNGKLMSTVPDSVSFKNKHWKFPTQLRILTKLQRVF
ncbi:unnamed protein product [Ambrosiozyma monospora]|uniref:Unnamed protein product n=1 Tax=Ambrosiozyma monospora TaxID=43982 RepID=A0ACB5SQY5_AMBMO|nr:unnamed protein product [Ambrosiozyma monospora]